MLKLEHRIQVLGQLVQRHLGQILVDLGHHLGLDRIGQEVAQVAERLGRRHQHQLVEAMGMSRLLEPLAERREAAQVGEQDRGLDPSAIAAPDGTSVFFCRTEAREGWTADFVTAGAPAAAGELTGIDHVGLSQPLVSWHVGRLRAAGLVETRRVGRETICRLLPHAFEASLDREREILGIARPDPARGIAS